MIIPMQVRDTIVSYLSELNINDCLDSWDIQDAIDNCGLQRELSCAHGETKICLIFTKLPYVLKWNNCQGSGDNEAYEEVDLYHEAQDKSIAQFFPETDYFGCVNGIEFIIQEKIDTSVQHCTFDLETKMQECSKTVTNRITEKFCAEIEAVDTECCRHIDRTWAKAAISLYGKFACRRFCKFVAEHHINDLHRGNIGYKNKKPIVLDFCGYHSSSDF